MINVDFLPSRRLALYLARLFLTRSFAVLVSLVLILMTLDLLGESGKILAVPGNGEPELWKYVSLRVPILAAKFLPFAALLGALIAFTGLNQHSEVVSMKAAGLSAHQILAPLIIASLGIAALAFAFNETVVVRATRTVTAWDDADYGKVPPDSGVLSNVWLRERDSLVHVGQVAGRGERLRLSRVTIFDRQGGALRQVIDAAEGRREGHGWRLSGVKVYDADQTMVRKLASLHRLDGVAPNRFTLAKVVPGQRGFISLGNAIRELEAAGRPSDEARTGWWHKISGPLSIVLMPLLAALAAFGLARSGKVLLRAVIGMALGFTYFVVDNVGIALGNAGAYPPALAAWAPFLLFLLIGETVLVRSEE